MKNRSHNKKRNVGIIYEQLINHMCHCVVENNEKNVSDINRIIKEHFKKNTQLFRELKFFNALIKTRDIDSVLANNIINEAKKACQYHFSNEDLEKEKSNLIKDLNYSFGKGLIFENKINNYKILATVQTLLNEWRKGRNADFEICTEYERQLHEWMTTKEPEILNEKIIHGNVDELTFRLMNERFNKKYENVLSENQKKIIKLFVELNSSNKMELQQEFENIKIKSLDLLKEFKHNCSNSILLEGYNNVENKVKNVDCSVLNEDNMKKFLTLCKLNEELKEGKINE
jgi:hypothetical protein